MLPTMMLQLTDLASFEPPAGGRSLLSEQQTTPLAGFAALLDLGIESADSLVPDGGQPLPVAGNPLPPVPELHAIAVERAPANPAGHSGLTLDRTPASRAPVSPVEPRLAAVLPVEPRLAAVLPVEPRLAAVLPVEPGFVAVGVAAEAPGTVRLRRQATLEISLSDPRAPRPEQAAIAAASVDSAGDQATGSRVGRAGNSSRPVIETLAAVTASTSTKSPPPGLEPLRQPLVPRDVQVTQGSGAGPLARAETATIHIEESGAHALPRGSQRQANQPAATGARIQTALAAALNTNAATAVEGVDAQSAQLPTSPAAQPAASFARIAVEPGAVQVQTGGTIEVPVTDAEWGEQLSQRVQLMASHKLQAAELRLTPAELGPLRVQVAVDDSAATVTFHAQHAVTREAIEQALPRLREMLAENGLTLADSSVGEQAVPDGRREPEEGGAVADAGMGEIASEAVGSEPQPERRSDGLVDTFA